MNREQFVSFFFIALLIFIVYQIFSIFAPFMKAIFWAAILAFGFYPIYDRCLKNFPKHPGLIAVGLTTVIFLIVLPPLVALLLNLADQAIDFSQTAYHYIRNGDLEGLIETIRSSKWIQRIETKIVEWEPIKKNLTDWSLNIAKAIGNYSASQVGTFTKNMFFIFLNVFFMIFLTFIFLKDGEKICAFIYEIAPFDSETKKTIFQQINETFAAVIRGQLLTSLVQAIVAGCIFWALGLPVPLFFAALTFIASFIPVSGAGSVWIPLFAYLLISHQYIKGLILLICGIFIISLLDNIIKPAIIGERTKLPYFLLFFGILGGLKLYGLMGIFLAPVILSIFFALAKIYQEQYL